MADYDIRLYTPDLLPQALEVLSDLWGGDVETNRSYFQWKYLDNPHADQPYGIVAMSHNTVVGFRGYFATRYMVPGRQEPMRVLVPGDTCTHPEHRRQGLSVQMGRLAMQAFAEVSPLFLNMTATHDSLPGYLKMGFQPLADKIYLSAYSLPGLCTYLATYYDQRPGRPIFAVGRNMSDTISVSEQSSPAAMAAIIAGQPRKEWKIALLQDEAYFRWRFANPRKRYLCYYHQQGGSLTGYVVIGLSPNMRRGYVLDAADSDNAAVPRILRHILRQRYMDIFSIYHFSLDAQCVTELSGIHLKQHDMLRWLERRKTGELPVLIRPTKIAYTETDWRISGLDVRDINNWHLKEIGSDAV